MLALMPLLAAADEDSAFAMVNDGRGWLGSATVGDSKIRDEIAFSYAGARDDAS